MFSEQIKGLIGTNQARFLLIWLASVFPKFQEALVLFTSLHLLMQLCKSEKHISKLLATIEIRSTIS